MDKAGQHWCRLVSLSIVFGAGIACPVAQAQKAAFQDCNSYIGPTTKANGQIIGPQVCAISGDVAFLNSSGVRYRRLEIGVSGTIEGYAPKDTNSRYSGYFSDIPEFAIAQRGDFGPYALAIGTYKAEKGSGMTVFIPESAGDWNGKLYVLVHGSAQYPQIGELVPRKAHQYNRYTGKNSFAGLMIDKGYAVAYTRRSGTKFGSKGGTESVTFMDGTAANDKAYDYHIGLLKDFTLLAQNLVKARLGRKPSRTYWWGHSAGAALGHLFNYAPGGNLDPDGKRLFDGILADDPGGGLYLPTLQFQRVGNRNLFSVKVDAKDQLVFDAAHRQVYAYQMDIVHQAYAGNDYVLGDYLTNKRLNARILLDKGLGDWNRTYEIVGVSHADAGGVPSEQASENLDLGGFYDSIIDALDKWVENGVAPSPTRSDAYDLAHPNKDERNENQAIELPEIACPTGIYYEFPEGVKTPGRTGFAAFLREPRQALNADTEPIPPEYDKAWLEPLDSRGYFLDMNKNSVRDTRDSITQAWRRRLTAGKKHGILAYNEALTHARYVSCVSDVALELVNQHLLSQDAANDYIAKAAASDIGSSVSEADQLRAVPVGLKKILAPAGR